MFSTEQLLLKNGAPADPAGSSDERNPLGRANPLQLAAFHDQTNAMEILIRAGADVNRADRQGFTPLHWAALRGAAGAAALLLKHKANPNSHIARPAPGSGPDFFMRPGLSIVGDTPLHLAALAGQTNVIQLLLNSKADINAVNAMSQTALDLAGGPPNSLAGFVMTQQRMAYLIEPFGVNRTPSNPLRVGRTGQQAAAALIEAAGGKHSQNNQPFGR